LRLVASTPLCIYMGFHAQNCGMRRVLRLARLTVLIDLNYVADAPKLMERPAFSQLGPNTMRNQLPTIFFDHARLLGVL
jgi:hypothetical protein